jgi:hypothetical protein
MTSYTCSTFGAWFGDFQSVRNCFLTTQSRQGNTGFYEGELTCLSWTFVHCCEVLVYWTELRRDDRKQSIVRLLLLGGLYIGNNLSPDPCAQRHWRGYSMQASRNQDKVNRW